MTFYFWFVQYFGLGSQQILFPTSDELYRLRMTKLIYSCDDLL